MTRYGFTIFLASFLLFLMQPVLGKLLLPEYGGSAGVWTVCLLFYQSLLLAGYKGMKQRETAIPEQGKIRLPEALDRLIELYTATDKPDEVQKWQAERARYPETKKGTEIK